MTDTPPNEDRNTQTELESAIAASEDMSEETQVSDGIGLVSGQSTSIDGTVADSQRQALLHSGTAEYYEIDEAAYIEAAGIRNTDGAIEESFTGARFQDVLDQISLGNDLGGPANEGAARDSESNGAVEAVNTSRVPVDVPGEGATSRESAAGEQAASTAGSGRSNRPASTIADGQGQAADPLVPTQEDDAPQATSETDPDTPQIDATFDPGSGDQPNPDGTATTAVDEFPIDPVTTDPDSPEPTDILAPTDPLPDTGTTTSVGADDPASSSPGDPSGIFNRAPEAVEFAPETVIENAVGAAIGTVTAVDPDGDDLSWTVDDPRFEVVGETVRLRDGESLDHEVEPTLQINLTATDAGGLQTTRTVEIDIQDVNEAPIDLSFDRLPLTENDAGASVGTLSGVDPEGAQLTWSVDDARFEVVDDTLRLRDGIALDHESEPDVGLTLTATDADGLETTQTVRINVADINEAPEGLIFDAVGIAENDEGATVGAVFADDPEGGILSWTVDDVRFEVVDGTLRLRDGQALDHEATPSIDLTLTATDPEGLQATQTVRIDVADIGEAPLDLSFDSTVLTENDRGAVAGTVSATDPEGGPVSWSVDDARFEVVGETVRLRDGVDLDHEAADHIDLLLTATDESGRETNLSVTLTVEDLNEAPEGIVFTAESLGEGTQGAVAGTLGATDPDGDPLTWSVDDSRFEVVDGVLKLTSDATLDYEAEPVVELVVTVTDADGLATAQTLTLDVADFDEAPDGIVLGGSVVAENAAGAVVGEVFATDPEGSALTWAVDDTRFEVADGKLRLRDGESLDHEAEPFVDLTLRVTDSSGQTSSREVRIDVADINEAPEGLQFDATVVVENDQGAVVGTVSATDPEGGPLTWTVDDARFEVIDGDIRLRDGQALDHEAEPSVDLNLTATDAGGLQTTQTARINVTDINEAPVDLVFAATPLSENHDGATVGSVSATDPEDGDLIWTVDDARFEVVGDTVRLRDGEHLDHESEPTVDLVLTATDDGRLAVSRTVQIDVQDINEAPNGLTFDATPVAENAAGATVGTVSAIDPEGRDLLWTVDDDRFEVIDGSVRLRDGTALDHEAEPTVDLTLTVTDAGGLQTTQIVEVNVQDINEAPVDLTFTPTVLDENDAGASVGTVSATDPEGGALTWTVDDARFEVVDGDVRLRDGHALDHEIDPTVDLVLTATDEGGLQTAQTVQIDVGDEVTTAPDVTVGATFHVRQIGVVETVTDLVGIDWGSDPIGETFVSRVDLSRDTDGLIDVDATDAFATLVNGYVDADVAGTYDLRLPASDTAILWVDGQPVAIDLEPGPLGLAEVSINLSEGPHEIVIQHLDLIGDGALRFEWRPPGETDFELAPPSADHVVEEGAELGLPLSVETHAMDLTAIVIEDVPANWILSDGNQTISSSGSDVNVTGWDLDQLSVSPALGDVGTTTIAIQTTTTSPSGETGTSTTLVDIDVQSADSVSILEVDLVDTLTDHGFDLASPDVDVDVPLEDGLGDDDGLLDPPPDPNPLGGAGLHI